MMSQEDILTVSYWVSLAIKAAIGIVVTMVGLDYRNVKNSLRELEQAKYSMSADIQVIRYETTAISGRLTLIDNKLDKALAQ
jgi:uncharacterized protein YoxC